MQDETMSPVTPYATLGTEREESSWTDDEHGVLVEPSEVTRVAPEMPREGTRRFYEF